MSNTDATAPDLYLSHTRGRLKLNVKEQDGIKERKKKRKREKKEKKNKKEENEEESGNENEEECRIFEASGRIVSSGTTVHGFETKFKEEIEIGDTVVIFHNVSLQTEDRIVTYVLSQRSLTMNVPFSSDLVSTSTFFIRKDSERLLSKARTKIQNDNQEEDENESEIKEEYEKHLSKRLKKHSTILTVREKKGMWSYKTVSTQINGDVSREDLLDMRVKMGRDKFC